MKRVSPWIFFVTSLVILLLGDALADSKTPVFKSSARVVVVDVVVLDNDGRPVSGLGQQDFTIEDNGSPQRVQQFEALKAPSGNTSLSELKLPAHQYTNFPVQEQGRAINIVLMDLLNTTPEQQIYARVQMLKFLSTLPPGQRTALYVLGRRLQMVQGFTGNSEDLIKAAEKVAHEKSIYVTSDSDAQHEHDRIGYLGAATGRGSEIVTSNLLQALQTSINYGAEARAGYTLAALQTLAKTVTGYAGRKNLLWLSSNFPFRLSPDPATEKITDYRRAIEETSNILAAAQMAVYPIDVEGLGSSGIDVSGVTMNYGGQQLVDQQRAVANRQTAIRWNTHSTMGEIAEHTGGQAFWGSNDLQHALSRAMERGSTYYTLVYSPRDVKWDGRYRKIEVKLNRPGMKLFYRRGYYASPDQEVKGDVAAKMLASALQPTSPEFTMLLMRVQVLPPDAENKKVRIDYALAPTDVTFVDTEDGKKRLLLDFMVAVFDKNGRDIAQLANTLDGKLPKESYDTMLKTGIPAHQELELKPGTYKLRLGVIDRVNQKIGTLEVPLTIGG